MNNILVQAPRLLNKHKKCKRFITSYQTKIRKEVFIMSIKLYNINEEYREKFYQIPKVFFTNPKYIKLSNDAKMAWGILRDRLDLSIKNGWVDSKTGNIYFFTKMKTHKIY
nr:replication initiator protein A [Staphylococcus aureus]